MDSVVIPTEFVKLAKELKFKLRDYFTSRSKHVDRMAKLNNLNIPLDILKRTNKKIIPFINQEELRNMLLSEERKLILELDPSNLYTEYTAKTTKLFNSLDNLGVFNGTPLDGVLNQFTTDTIRNAKVKWADLVATQLVSREKAMERAKQKLKDQERLIDTLGVNPSKETLFQAVSQLVDLKMKKGLKTAKKGKNANPNSFRQKSASSSSSHQEQSFHTKPHQHKQYKSPQQQKQKRGSKPQSKRYNFKNPDNKQRALPQKGFQPSHPNKRFSTPNRSNPRESSYPKRFIPPPFMEIDKPQKKSKNTLEHVSNKSSKRKKASSNGKPSTRSELEGF